jgi:hypothetical protein
MTVSLDARMNFTPSASCCAGCLRQVCASTDVASSDVRRNVSNSNEAQGWPGERHRLVSAFVPVRSVRAGVDVLRRPASPATAIRHCITCSMLLPIRRVGDGWRKRRSRPLNRLIHFVLRIGQDDRVALSNACWTVAYVLRDLTHAQSPVDRGGRRHGACRRGAASRTFHPRRGT